MNRWLRSRGLFALCGLSAWLAVKPIAAQEALVLSGGGSRGLAHVGVLLGLSELGYHPTMVVGTSMGAVVGALYAAGYAPSEIRDRVLGIRWGDLFQQTPVIGSPERTVRYPLINVDLEVEPLRFSRGVVGQWRINRALASLLFDANARSRGNFDRLARRYRAVATDLKTGEAVVLASGDLARAARASMAVPAFFAPLQWDERVLVDGGIVDNLPTGQARKLGAARVIAVEVSREPPNIHSLAPLAVLSRALDIMQRAAQHDELPPDLLVVPSLPPGFSGAFFPDDPRWLFEIGLAAARRDLPRAPSADVATRPMPLPPDSLAGLIIEAPDAALEALARNSFAGVAPGRYDAQAVMKAMDRLYSTGLFEGVWPRVQLQTDTTLAPALHVRLEAQPRTALLLSGRFETDRGGQLWASLDRYLRLGLHPAVLSASASRDGIELYALLSARVYALTSQPFAWSVGVYSSKRDVRSFADDTRIIKEAGRSGGWVGLEFPHLLRDRLLTAMVRGELIDIEDDRRGSSVGPLLRFTSIDPETRVVGEPLLLEAEARWGPIAYRRLVVRGGPALELGPLRIAPVADARLVSSRAPSDVWPALGDDHAVPGLRWGELRAHNRIVGGIDVAHPLPLGYARLRLRSGAVAQTLDALNDVRWISGAEVGFIWPNPIGTVEVAYGRNTMNSNRIDVVLGRRF
jgi:predicted acylesterase/phospholipase RssA